MPRFDFLVAADIKEELLPVLQLPFYHESGVGGYPDGCIAVLLEARLPWETQFLLECLSHKQLLLQPSCGDAGLGGGY